jgi:hypothetical protein
LKGLHRLSLPKNVGDFHPYKLYPMIVGEDFNFTTITIHD